MRTTLDYLSFDLKTLNVFVAVADAGSITGGAESLGMTQPAVTKHIKRLEEDIGAALLERRVRPFRPTTAGLELLNGARKLLSDAEHLQATVREVGEATLPEVRIGLIDSFAATAGPRLIREIRNYARNVVVWSGITPNLREDLSRRRLDFIVTTDPMTEKTDLERHTLLTEPFVLVMPQRMATNILNPDIANLAHNHPFVRYSVRSLIGETIENHLAGQGISIGESLQFDGTEAVFAMVSAGLGWAITTPLCMVHGFAHMPSLSALPLPGETLSRTLYLVARKGEHGTLPARIAHDARGIAEDMVSNRVKGLAPWAAEQMSVG